MERFSLTHSVTLSLYGNSEAGSQKSVRHVCQTVTSICRCSQSLTEQHLHWQGVLLRDPCLKTLTDGALHSICISLRFAFLNRLCYQKLMFRLVYELGHLATTVIEVHTEGDVFFMVIKHVWLIHVSQFRSLILDEYTDIPDQYDFL